MARLIHGVNEHKIDCIIWSIILPVATHMHYARKQMSFHLALRKLLLSFAICISIYMLKHNRGVFHLFIFHLARIPRKQMSQLAHNYTTSDISFFLILFKR